MSGSTVILSMSYRNAPEAIDWLCRVFGFEKRAVYPGPNHTIVHAELTLGNGMLMIGSHRDDEDPRLSKHPDEIGGAETRGANLVVDDADEVYARARAAGAEILCGIESKPYGGRAFTCRDPEGHIWNAGTYNPWQAKPGEGG